MAKSDSIIKLQGTIAGLTFVRSRAYGDHVRSKRGTYKRADVNEALKQESKTLVSANVPAKIFKNAIDPYRSNIMGGTLWQRLVSMFRKQLKDFGSIDFAKIERFEVHADYPFDRFLLLQPTITFEKKNYILHVNMEYDHHPKFKVKDIDGYRFTVITIFPDLEKKTAKTVAVQSNVIGLSKNISPLQLQLKVPAKAKSFIVCVRIEGYVRDEVSSTRTTNGLCVFGSGVI